MALSSSYNYVTTRDGIISRALRIIGAIGQGETPTATAVTEASYALNEIIKEWNADGMQIWKQTNISIPLADATASYQIYPAAVAPNVNSVAPLRVLYALVRNESTNADVPLRLLTRHEYDLISNKTQEATIPTQFYYDVPMMTSGAEAVGTLYVWPVPNSADYTVVITGVLPIMDFDSSSDNPDVPPHYINALTWALADQLCYEYGVGLSERAMIAKKAQQHKLIALSFDQEEGSLFIRPEEDYGN